MKTSESILKEIKDIIATGSYYINAEYCHPERVPSEALTRVEETAEEYLQNMSDSDITSMIDELDAVNDDDIHFDSILTRLADLGADHQHYETITPVVSITGH